ncbi:hypothetical protein NE237_020425 [Protea cynaroides]|uniref:Uncharacterized protein n=1 Tax=Protea cynaroides TaxID=273540 RepID=A0A9Q0K3F0_9MAGN|nr:hypothetical protein NE237_020425 [Protea cynaroides]
MSSCRDFVLALEAEMQFPSLAIGDIQSCSPEPQPLQSIPPNPPCCFEDKPPPTPTNKPSDAPLEPSDLSASEEDHFPTLAPSSKAKNGSVPDRNCPLRPKNPEVTDEVITNVKENPSHIPEKQEVRDQKVSGEEEFEKPKGKNRRRVRKMNSMDSGQGKNRVLLEPTEEGISSFQILNPIPQDKALQSETVLPAPPSMPQSCPHATSIPTYLNPFDPIANLSESDPDYPIWPPPDRQQSASKKQLASSVIKPLKSRAKSLAKKPTPATIITSPFKPLNPTPPLNPLSINLRPSVSSHFRTKLPTLPFSRLAILEPTLDPSSNPVPTSFGEPPLVAVPKDKTGLSTVGSLGVESEMGDSDSESQLSDDWDSLNKDHLMVTKGSDVEGGQKLGYPKTSRISSKSG